MDISLKTVPTFLLYQYFLLPLAVSWTTLPCAHIFLPTTLFSWFVCLFVFTHNFILRSCYMLHSSHFSFDLTSGRFLSSLFCWNIVHQVKLIYFIVAHVLIFNGQLSILILSHNPVNHSPFKTLSFVFTTLFFSFPFYWVFLFTVFCCFHLISLTYWSGSWLSLNSFFSKTHSMSLWFPYKSEH